MRRVLLLAFAVACAWGSDRLTVRISGGAGQGCDPLPTR